ncbi:ISAzo13 family transposase [Streptosporangium sp. NPDC051023]|uniref:ISAzo13 family transposase n=1 Tax=Streptosporangium sp. NPDC051023 TaxID=3155410 RepID=UPI00344CBDBC
MGVAAETVALLAAKFEVILPHLDERQRRLLMGAEARALGHGGIAAVARAAGVRAATVSLGVDELEAGVEPLGRIRRPGGGRKRLVETDPGVRTALLALVEPDTRGDPMSPLRWTTLSTRRLARQLTAQGHRIGADTVADLLRQEGFSLQSNAKTLEGKQHPDRDAQFRYLNERVKTHQAAGQPVISVDTKKKELIGEFKTAGRQWRPAGRPVQVAVHDFPDRDLGKAIPYGVYDLTADSGWVNVGTDHDTAAFAVESIRRWWNGTGQETYPDATRLLITADAGGSNGYRTRAWKAELAALAAQTGLEITVCHFPPGTSKWNRIEHRLFCHITMNWQGRPLASHEVIVQTIAATTTTTGLAVHAELDTGQYATGVTVSDAHMAELPIVSHDWHGEWNYTLLPAWAPITTDPAATTASPRRDRRDDRAWLAYPALTGLAQREWDQLIDQLTLLRHDQREADLHCQRGGPRKVAAGTGRHPCLTLTERLLITVLHHRLGLPQAVLADLFQVTLMTANRAIRQIRPLLKQVDYIITPIQKRLYTAADLTAYALSTDAFPSEINSAC